MFDPVEYLRTDHYGHEQRPEYLYTCVGLVLKRDPLDAAWWRPLIVVCTYAPLSRHRDRSVLPRFLR